MAYSGETRKALLVVPDFSVQITVDIEAFPKLQFLGKQPWI
jgi:hypothetical protein